MARTVFQSPRDYLAAQPPATRRVLQQVRRIIAETLPQADEVISYGILAFKLHGRIVLYLAGWKDHYSLYPSNRRLEAAFEGRLARYETSGKGTIRFPLTAPVPARLIADIAAFRAKEVTEHVAKQAAKKKAAKRR